MKHTAGPSKQRSEINSILLTLIATTEHDVCLFWASSSTLSYPFSVSYSFFPTPMRCRLVQSSLPWLQDVEDLVTWFGWQSGGKAEQPTAPPYSDDAEHPVCSQRAASMCGCEHTMDVLRIWRWVWRAWGGVCMCGCGCVWGVFRALSESVHPSESVYKMYWCAAGLPGYRNNTPRRQPGIPMFSQMWLLDLLALHTLSEAVIYIRRVLRQLHCC